MLHPLTWVSWMFLAGCLVIAAGCGQDYEYTPNSESLEISRGASEKRLLDQGPREITSSALGQVFLRFGIANSDAISIITAVKILGKEPRAAGGCSTEELENRLKEAVAIDPDDEILAAVAERVAEALDERIRAAAGPDKKWRIGSRNFDDAGLTELVWSYGQSNNDQLAMITSVIVLARMPAGDGVPSSEDLSRRLENAFKGLPDDPVLIALGERAANEIDSRDERTRSLADENRRKGTDWPTFLGPTGDGKSSEKGISTSWPLNGPRVVWQRKVGSGYGMCAIKDGRVYLFDRHGNRARLTSMDAENGEDLWQFEYDTSYLDQGGYSGGPRCSPVVDEDRVYIYGSEGWLHCLSTETGGRIWDDAPRTAEPE